MQTVIRTQFKPFWALINTSSWGSIEQFFWTFILNIMLNEFIFRYVFIYLDHVMDWFLTVTMKLSHEDLFLLTLHNYGFLSFTLLNFLYMVYNWLIAMNFYTSFSEFLLIITLIYCTVRLIVHCPRFGWNVCDRVFNHVFYNGDRPDH